jgi:hypothetical protein
MLIIAVVIIVLLVVFAGPLLATFIGGKLLFEIIGLILVIITIFLLPRANIPNYYGLIAVAYGERLAKAVLILGITIIGALGVLARKSLEGSILLSGSIFSLLFIILPFASGKVFPALFPIKQTTSVFFASAREIKLPGGIEVDFGGTGQTVPPYILGGEDYFYVPYVKNNYDKNVNILFEPYIDASYHGNTIRFVNKNLNRKLSLSAGEDWQEELLFKRSEMEIDRSVTEECPYTKKVLEEYYKKLGFTEEEMGIECAKDVNCPKAEQVCVKTGSAKCECVDWTKATCEGSAKLGAKTQYDGFMVGKLSMYYTKETMKTVEAETFTQGPLMVVAKLYPNPWIEKIHNFTRDSVSLYVTLTSRSAEDYCDITITSFSIKPLNTRVITSLTGYSPELNKIINYTIIEEVGMEVKSLNQELIGEKLKKGIPIMRKIGELSPPRIKVVFSGIVGEENISEQVAYEELERYCEKGYKDVIERKVDKATAEKIAKILGSSQICDILKGVKKEYKGEGLTIEELKQKVENMLREIPISFEIDYEVNTIFTNYVSIDKNTEYCLIEAQK